MFRYIYKSYFPGIRSMVLGFRSLVLDAEDIFQDGLIDASNNLREGKFKGDSSFNTYLTSICRNKCRKQLERAARFGNNISTIDVADEPEADIEDLIARLTLLKERMDEKCKKIIDLRFGLDKYNSELKINSENCSNIRFEEIASKLNIEADTARQRFKRCLEKLKETVLADSSWSDLLATV
ncbi:MAG: sigma-70 family RNA polymerase sigma factor [Bacteroidales bacterium]|nr:sigma-70 family RNA polymerase sigma factor [Bacteroidales bacterium]